MQSYEIVRKDAAEPGINTTGLQQNDKVVCSLGV